MTNWRNSLLKQWTLIYITQKKKWPVILNDLFSVHEGFGQSQHTSLCDMTKIADTLERTLDSTYPTGTKLELIVSIWLCYSSVRSSKRIRKGKNKGESWVEHCENFQLHTVVRQGLVSEHRKLVDVVVKIPLLESSTTVTKSTVVLN